MDVKHENRNMRQRFIVPLIIAVGICAAALIFLQSWSVKYANCRKEPPTNKMIWETIPQQFFSSF